MNPSDHPSPEAPADEQQAPSPRAFAQGVGLILQTTGALLVMSQCCICSSSFLWDPQRTPDLIDTTAPKPDALTRLGELAANPGKAGLMLTVMGATVGGLGMMGFGLGLQSDRRRSAVGAFWTCLLFTLVMLIAGAGLWIGESSTSARGWQALLMLLGVVLTGFCITAWRQVRANPPPDDIDVIPPGFKIPYSMHHDDPPDVRLAKELANRRARLEAEQRELEQLERELKQRDQS